MVLDNPVEDIPMSFLNFEEIKAANPISEVVERLSLNLNKAGSSFRGKCPTCESSGDRNLVVTPEKGVFFCFTWGKGGDQIQLVSHVKGIGAKEAASWLSGAERSKEKATKGEPPSEGFKPLEYLIHDHEAVVALGFEPGDAERLGIGYAPRGMLKGKVAIPVRLANGKLAGYVGATELHLPPKWSW
jgi:DNA primase